jgi:hypothetical protein
MNMPATTTAPGATARAKRSTAPAMATTIATPNFSAPIPS